MSVVAENVATALDRAAQSHNVGEFQKLATILESVEAFSESGDSRAAENVAIALNFLDGWVDAANHEWLHYDGIEKNDWPDLAALIATGLRSNRPIMAPIILRHFKVKGSTRDPSILIRIVKLFRF
jgi:hypothetical protein